MAVLKDQIESSVSDISEDLHRNRGEKMRHQFVRIGDRGIEGGTSGPNSVFKAV